MLGAVSRLTDQKGFDLVADVLERLLAERDVQVAILGSGEAALENRLRALCTKYPLRIAVRFGYDEPLSHRIYAASDLYLMPSRWEPCGLGQMYALRYGAVPIVRATGGLDDTIIDYDARSSSGTGFKFTTPTAAAFDGSLRRGLALHGNEEAFAALQRRGMLQDFSWGSAARAYRSLYETLVHDPQGRAEAHV
jgi:starch synthase